MRRQRERAGVQRDGRGLHLRPPSCIAIAFVRGFQRRTLGTARSIRLGQRSIASSSHPVAPKTPCSHILLHVRNCMGHVLMATKNTARVRMSCKASLSLPTPRLQPMYAPCHVLEGGRVEPAVEVRGDERPHCRQRRQLGRRENNLRTKRVLPRDRRYTQQNERRKRKTLQRKTLQDDRQQRVPC